MNMKLNNILFKLNSEEDILAFLHSYYILAFHIDDVSNITIMHYNNTIKYHIKNLTTKIWSSFRSDVLYINIANGMFLYIIWGSFILWRALGEVEAIIWLV